MLINRVVMVSVCVYEIMIRGGGGGGNVIRDQCKMYFKLCTLPSLISRQEQPRYRLGVCQVDCGLFEFLVFVHN